MIDNKSYISDKLELRKSPIQGMGLFAGENIERGELLVVWKGLYVNKKRAREYQKLGKLVMQWDDDLFSVEDSGSDDAYFINHSCDSNMWMRDAYSLISRKTINKGEELTADYALWEADENYISRWNCKCGSKYCRGRVTGKDWQNIEIQKRYEGHFSPLINKKIVAFLLR